MTHLPRTHQVLVSIGAVSLAVAGCGDDGSSSSRVATTPATTDAAATDVTPTNATAGPDRAAAVQAALDDFVAGSGSPGGVVAVSLGGAEPMVVTSGLADRRTDTAMPDDPRFFTGKIGGLFVNAVALQLVSEGALSLDDPVAVHLPDAPFADDITIRQLLTHTSGFRDWTLADLPLAGELDQLVAPDHSHRFTSDEMIDFMRHRPLRLEPGTGALHAEFNTLLLRLIIEHVTSQDFSRLLDDRILGPLALRGTAFGFDAAPHGELLPGLYRQPPAPGDQWTTDFEGAAFVTSFYAAAPISSTVSDLMRWGDAYYRSGEVVPRDIADEAAEPNEFGSTLQGIALTEDGVCVMLVNCSAGARDYVGFGQPSLARGAYAGLFYHRPLDAVIFVLVNNTGVSIRPLYAAVRRTL